MAHSEEVSAKIISSAAGSVQEGLEKRAAHGERKSRRERSSFRKRPRRSLDKLWKETKLSSTSRHSHIHCKDHWWICGTDYFGSESKVILADGAAKEGRRCRKCQRGGLDISLDQPQGR